MEKQPLSRELILTTALALLDADGLNAVSMRGLADHLGVTPMALYNHFQDKEAIFDALHEAVLFDASPARKLPRRGWKDMARVLGASLRRALRAHPNALMLFATRPLRSLPLLKIADEFLSQALSAGFTSRQALFLLDSIGVYTVGHALAEFGASPAAAPSRNGEDLAAQRASLVENGLDTLVRVVSETAPHDYDAEFEMGLCALVDGFSMQLKSARA